MLNEIVLKRWKACEYLPIAVAIVAGTSGWIVLGYGVYTETSGVSNADEESKSRYRYFHDR